VRADQRVKLAAAEGEGQAGGIVCHGRGKG
jgi:hypothetical protein